MVTLQDINLGSGPTAGDGDQTYDAINKLKANQIAINTELSNAGDIKIREYPVALAGLSSGLTELEQIAAAINAKDPGFSVPLGFLPVISYYEPLTPGTLSDYFRKTSYAVKTGAGDYGQGFVSPIVVTAANLVKLGEIAHLPPTVIDLGEIGATDIATAVNNSSTELVFELETLVNALRSGAPAQYMSSGLIGSYGASWQSSAAGNFVDTRESASLEVEGSEKTQLIESKDANLTIAVANLYKHTLFTQADATVTIDPDATLELAVGANGHLSFKGTGKHTVNYPITDGVSTQTFEAGAFVYYEKRGADEWIVREIGTSPSLSDVKVKQVQLTAGQLHTGNSVEVEIVPLLAGIVRRPVAVDFDFIHGGTDHDYTGNGYAYIKHNGKPNTEAFFALNASSSNLKATGDWYEAVPDWTKRSVGEGAAIVFATDSDTATTNGTGTLKVTVFYVEYKR